MNRFDSTDPPAGVLPLRIVPMTLAEANKFIRQHHRHSRPVPGAKFAIGVMDTAGVLRGVATVV